MKTSFKIAWVDDNFSDEQMQISMSRLSRKLKRKNGCTLVAEDIFSESAGGNFDDILNGLANVVDSSNSIDLALIDYELSQLNDKSGTVLTGQGIAKRFRDALPSVDIVFYSGKKNAEELRLILAEANVDCVNCVGRGRLVDDAYTVIENVINRSCKISTLRGLVLNSVCEMDNMIVDILCRYSASNTGQEDVVKTKAANLIKVRATPTQIQALKRNSVEDLLRRKQMMSGKLFSILFDIRNNLGLTQAQLNLLGTYRSEILDLRTSAAHAKETVCPTTGQAMLEFKSKRYMRGDIDGICKVIVTHENNIQSILQTLI